MIDETILKREEKAVFSLRSLYRNYGYFPYKMSKFEEYELYVRNKDFLVSDRIITFNDTDGKLLALKPDVTLSIIRSSQYTHGCKQKVCYDENVYRVSQSTHRYKEIMQAGLECIGDIDFYDIFEVVSLACESLNLISDDFVLEISNLEILYDALKRACDDETFCKEALSLIAEKNAHDLERLCEKYDIRPMDTQMLQAFVTTYGERSRVISLLEKYCGSKAVQPMKELSELLNNLPYSDKILFDFSVVNDMNYYNGFVFKGFLKGICDGVLAGGQYDRLMQKMNKQSGAVGFAIYLDLLEQLTDSIKDDFVDIILLYDDSTSPQKLVRTIFELRKNNKTVSAQKIIPQNLSADEILDLRGDVKC